MRAAYIEALGNAEAIRYGELPDPVPSAGQVLVRVEAVTVNSVDTYLRSGRWPTELSFPLALGRDLVGTVAAVGPSVAGFEMGESVWTNSAGYGGRPGATAELVAVEHERLYRLPDGADPVDFVAAVHPGATAHGALIQRARLAPGERVALVGANGAIGMCMVQVASGHGAEVIAVVRSDRRVPRRERAGRCRRCRQATGPARPDRPRRRSPASGARALGVLRPRSPDARLHHERDEGGRTRGGGRLVLRPVT